MLGSISSDFDSGQAVTHSSLQLHRLLPSTSSGHLPFLFEHHQTLRQDIDRTAIHPIFAYLTSLFVTIDLLIFCYCTIVAYRLLQLPSSSLS